MGRHLGEYGREEVGKRSWCVRQDEHADHAREGGQQDETPGRGSQGTDDPTRGLRGLRAARGIGYSGHEAISSWSGIARQTRGSRRISMTCRLVNAFVDGLERTGASRLASGRLSICAEGHIPGRAACGLAVGDAPHFLYPAILAIRGPGSKAESEMGRLWARAGRQGWHAHSRQLWPSREKIWKAAWMLST